MAYQVWPVLDVLMIIAGVFIGRSLAARLEGNQRKVVSGIAFLVGVAVIIYGIISLISSSSRTTGLPNVGGMAAIGVGGLAAMAAIVMVLSKGRQSGFTLGR